MITDAVIGFCPQCDERREADAIDILFDLKPSCSKCGTFLEEPFSVECLKNMEAL